KYLNKNDLNNAYNIYADLTISDTSSNKSIKENIIGLLRYNYNLILSVKSLRARGLSNNDIKNELSIQDFQLRDISEVEKNHDEKYFVDKLLKLYEYNKRLRMDTIEKDVVIELLMN
ncbi:MAG: hypothetical protein MJ151_04555, partial [Lachnospiraceae bacterium]|nr:hypothetical protein [Lachnospiraceae bacterium]